MAVHAASACTSILTQTRYTIHGMPNARSQAIRWLQAGRGAFVEAFAVSRAGVRGSGAGAGTNSHGAAAGGDAPAPACSPSKRPPNAPQSLLRLALLYRSWLGPAVPWRLRACRRPVRHGDSSTHCYALVGNSSVHRTVLDGNRAPSPGLGAVGLAAYSCNTPLLPPLPALSPPALCHTSHVMACRHCRMN
jgi:hypothetical protein